jgi:hypothetical protein
VRIKLSYNSLFVGVRYEEDGKGVFGRKGVEGDMK